MNRNHIIIALAALMAALAIWLAFASPPGQQVEAKELSHTDSASNSRPANPPDLAQPPLAGVAEPAVQPELAPKPAARELVPVVSEVQLRLLDSATRRPINGQAITIRPFETTDLFSSATFKLSVDERQELDRQIANFKKATPPQFGRSNAEGFITIFGLIPGQYVIALKGTTRMLTSSNVLKINKLGQRASNRDLLGYATVEVRGRIVDAKTLRGVNHGRVVTSHSTSRFERGGATTYRVKIPSLSGQNEVRQTTTEDGAFKFTNLLPNREYRLTLGGADHAFIEQTITTPAPGGKLNLGNISVPRGIQVDLELVNSNGDPLPDRPIFIAKVTSDDADGTRVKEHGSDWLTFPPRTDSGGRAHSQAFTAGTWALISTDLAGKEAEVTRFTLPINSQPHDLRAVWR